MKTDVRSRSLVATPTGEGHVQYFKVKTSCGLVSVYGTLIVVAICKLTSDTHIPVSYSRLIFDKVVSNKLWNIKFHYIKTEVTKIGIM